MPLQGKEEDQGVLPHGRLPTQETRSLLVAFGSLFHISLRNEGKLMLLDCHAR